MELLNIVSQILLWTGAMLQMQLTAMTKYWLPLTDYASIQGLPQNIVVDHDRIWTSKFWTALCKHLNIKMNTALSRFLTK